MTTRPRYGRIAAFSAAVLVTGTAFLGGAGVLPSGGQASYAAQPHDAGTPSTDAADPADSTDPAAAAPDGALELSAEVGEPASGSEQADLGVPADSGEGRRVVFDMGAQRVWLVKGDETVARTYPVSGSIYDNLQPGSYEVYSRSERAWGIDDSGTMRWMVRFTQGANAAIGFHDIPVDDGKRVQTRAELGTPLSHGCIRQARPDAKALWDFAPLGTPVVVVDSAA